MRSVELFAGAGGLALGGHAAGFQHELVVERDADTCSTIRANQQRGLEPLTHWRLFDDDIRKFDYTDLPKGIDFISGGPPCQPFSMGEMCIRDRGMTTTQLLINQNTAFRSNKHAWIIGQCL